MTFPLFMHHIVFVLYIFVLTCSLPLVLSFFFVFLSLLCVLILILAPCLRRLELIRFPLLLLCLPLGVSFLRTTVVVRRLRNWIVSIRFRLSVLWFLMRFMVCERIWHGFDVLHRHLLLMMDFDCPLAFRLKKGEYILRALCFCFQRESRFLLVGACGVV